MSGAVSHVVSFRKHLHREWELKALEDHKRYMNAPFKPTQELIDKVEFRLRRYLRLRVSDLHTRGQWEQALRDLQFAELLARGPLPEPPTWDHPEIDDPEIT